MRVLERLLDPRAPAPPRRRRRPRGSCSRLCSRRRRRRSWGAAAGRSRPPPAAAPPGPTARCGACRFGVTRMRSWSAVCNHGWRAKAPRLWRGDRLQRSRASRSGSRGDDHLGGDAVGHQLEQLVARVEVVVERHRAGAQLARDAADGDRVDPLGVCDGERGRRRSGRATARRRARGRAARCAPEIGGRGSRGGRPGRPWRFGLIRPRPGPVAGSHARIVSPASAGSFGLDIRTVYR